MQAADHPGTGRVQEEVTMKIGTALFTGAWLAAFVYASQFLPEKTADAVVGFGMFITVLIGIGKLIDRKKPI